MKKLTLIAVILFSLFNIAFAQQQKVYYADIEGMIDLGLAPYVKRVISEAEKNRASAIVFRINTFGGRVDAATQIKDEILNSKVRTIAFIDKRAISAGALIALSCEKIVMTPGASMGASTVVDETGQKQSEKYQSYMRSEMRATAEKNGRRADIAQAMVDERIVIREIDDDSTRLVTLTAKEALQYGMCDTISGNVRQVLTSFGINNPEIIGSETNWAEDLVRFLNNPIISSILIMIGLVGLFVEIKTPGWGLPGTAALIALTLFFGSGYILNIASIIEIVLFVAGVILLVLEIFVIPGFGIAGIMGIILMIAGLFLGLVSDFPLIDFGIIRNALLQLTGAFVAGGIMIFFLSRILPKSSSFNRLILHQEETPEEGFVSNTPRLTLLNAEGTSLTVLRPSGTVIINGMRIDALTEGEYIEKGKPVVVARVEGSKVFVREID